MKHVHDPGRPSYGHECLPYSRHSSRTSPRIECFCFHVAKNSVGETAHRLQLEVARLSVSNLASSVPLRVVLFGSASFCPRLPSPALARHVGGRLACSAMLSHLHRSRFNLVMQEKLHCMCQLARFAKRCDAKASARCDCCSQGKSSLDQEPTTFQHRLIRMHPEEAPQSGESWCPDSAGPPFSVMSMSCMIGKKLARTCINSMVWVTCGIFSPIAKFR